MAVTGVMRLGLIQLRVSDLEAAGTHYEAYLGMEAVCRSPDARVFFKASGEFDHHCLALRKASPPGVDFIGFKVREELYLSLLEERTKAFGLPCKRIPPAFDQPGYGRRLSVEMPTGHRFDFYAEVEMAREYPGLRNPDLRKREERGMEVSCLDHVFLSGPDAAEAARYCETVMGMGVSEVCKTQDGLSNLCVWLTASSKSCDLAIMEGTRRGELHHVGFRVEGIHDLLRAADLVSVFGIAPDTELMRHGATREYGVACFDPSGNRNEICTGGYGYFPDMPVRVWDYEEMGKGFCYNTRRREGFPPPGL